MASEKAVRSGIPELPQAQREGALPVPTSRHETLGPVS
jgi:hypothetical protein